MRRSSRHPRALPLAELGELVAVTAYAKPPVQAAGGDVAGRGDDRAQRRTKRPAKLDRMARPE
jgi:hypothetical protein